MKIGCLILASGQGKRFGSNKLLAELCGLCAALFFLHRTRQQS